MAGGALVCGRRLSRWCGWAGIAFCLVPDESLARQQVTPHDKLAQARLEALLKAFK